MGVDTFVPSAGGVRIAARDLGGDGPGLILLHGAGSHLLSLLSFAAHFHGYRVVAMDSRWSGQSGDSPDYDWDLLVADVEAVAAHFGIEQPIVVGHSWGGMIAAFYGRAHPEAPAVVNLDGHGTGNRSLYDGLSDDDAAAGAAVLERLSLQRDPVETGDQEWVREARAATRRQAEAMGVRAADLDEFVERGFVDLGGGRWRRHPSSVLFEGLQGDLGLFDRYREVRCPLLLFNCSKQPPGVPDELVAFMSAYRRGLGRALEELAAQMDNLRVVQRAEVDHVSIVTKDAAIIAADVRSFLAEVGAGPA